MPLRSNTPYQDMENNDLRSSLINDTPMNINGFNQTKSVMYALLTALCFALHNFAIGNLAHNGYMTRMMTGIGMMIPALLYYLRMWFEDYQNGVKFFRMDNSVFKNKYTEKFEKWILVGVIVSVALILIGGALVIYSFKFALEANINQGIITSIYGLTPFVVSVLFYFFFKECLKVSQVIGMVFMIGCIVLIGFGVKGHKASATPGEDSESSSAYLAILLSVICPFFFAASGLVMRMMKNKYNVDAYEFTQTYYIFQGVLLLIVVPVVYVAGNYQFTIFEIVQLLVAGCISSTAGVFLNMSITLGNAGVAYSLLNGQVIFFTILATVLLQQIPSNLEILAALIGIVGSCIMSAGSDISKKIKECWKTKEVDNYHPI